MKNKKQLSQMINAAAKGNSVGFKKYMEEVLDDRIRKVMELKKVEISTKLVNEANSVLPHENKVSHFAQKHATQYKGHSALEALTWIASIAVLSDSEKKEVWKKILDQKEYSEVEILDMNNGDFYFPFLDTQSEQERS